jgi:hypothetical protein
MTAHDAEKNAVIQCNMHALDRNGDLHHDNAGHAG